MSNRQHLFVGAGLLLIAVVAAGCSFENPERDSTQRAALTPGDLDPPGSPGNCENVGDQGTCLEIEDVAVEVECVDDTAVDVSLTVSVHTTGSTDSVEFYYAFDGADLTRLDPAYDIPSGWPGGTQNGRHKYASTSFVLTEDLDNGEHVVVVCAVQSGSAQGPGQGREPKADCDEVTFVVNCGCTYTKGYWKNHREDWPEYQDTILCATEEQTVTWGEAIALGGTFFGNLASQYVAAELNLLVNEASTPDEVLEALDEAEEQLADCEVTHDDWTGGAEATKDTLDDYNMGVIGPGHCDDE